MLEIVGIFFFFPNISEPIRSFHPQKKIHPEKWLLKWDKQGVRIPFEMASQKQHEAMIFSNSYHLGVDLEYKFLIDICRNESVIKARASTIKFGSDHQFWCWSQLRTISWKCEQANLSKHDFKWDLCRQIYFSSKVNSRTWAFVVTQARLPMLRDLLRSDFRWWLWTTCVQN